MIRHAILFQRLHEPDLVADAVLADVVARLPGDEADDDEGTPWQDRVSVRTAGLGEAVGVEVSKFFISPHNGYVFTKIEGKRRWSKRYP